MEPPPLMFCTGGEGEPADLELLAELAATVKEASLCGLGQTAPNPVLSTLASFKEEYLSHIIDKRCPAKVCKALIDYAVDAVRCTGCLLCLRGCPAQAIEELARPLAVSRPESSLSGKPAKKRAGVCRIDTARCVKCGICFANCPQGAVIKKDRPRTAEPSAPAALP